MKALYDLKDKLCMELEKIAKKRDMSAGDLEMTHKLTDTIKNIDKILMMEEQGYSEDGYSRDGYSGAGTWRANMEGNYGHGSSYARHRDSMGRYSRNGYSRGNDMVDMMEDALNNAKTDRERDAIERCLREMRG